VYVALTSAVDFCVRNRAWIAIGALAVVVAFAAGYYLQVQKRRTAMEASWRLYEAMQNELPSEKVAALREVQSEYGGSPSARVALFELANVLYGQGRYEEALKEYREFLKRHPGHMLAPAAMEAVGYCQESLGQWKEAQETYQSLMKRWPSSPHAERAHYRLGLACEKAGETDKAIEAYKKVLELQPESLWADYAREQLEALGVTEIAPPAKQMPVG
jgi:tetratricopeptide (TPR) repeat protein